jgi:hypothetical protein
MGTGVTASGGGSVVLTARVAADCQADCPRKRTGKIFSSIYVYSFHTTFLMAFLLGKM